MSCLREPWGASLEQVDWWLSSGASDAKTTFFGFPNRVADEKNHASWRKRKLVGCVGGRDWRVKALGHQPYRDDDRATRDTAAGYGRRGSQSAGGAKWSGWQAPQRHVGSYSEGGSSSSWSRWT